MMNKRLLKTLYYNKNLSMMDIAHSLNTTHARVYYWFKRHNIKRRSWSESAYVKQNPNGDPFQIKDKLTAKEKELLLASLMLYWAEGNRTNKHSIQLANLDHRILKIFVEFLRKICGIHENKITLYVQLYRKFNKEQAETYWSKTLKIPRSQIIVNPHTDKRSKGEEQRSKFGIARIQIHNYKLKNWLDRKLNYHLLKWK
jgi:predicted DNA-binding protein YlxM (UPF0122 family)